MKVLVACEYSGRVRDAFRRNGHDAISCDLLPTEVEGPHHQGDCLELAYSGEFDLMVAHPPCTFLTNSGVRWLEGDDQRLADMEAAAEFFCVLRDAPIEHIALENPIPHGYALHHMGPYTQIIQPWQFGHGETKATCLWLKNLPPLYATDVVEGREQRIHKLPPGPDRWKERSRTFQGIADAMADQWHEPRNYQQCLV